MDIYSEIKKERARQDRLHTVAPTFCDENDHQFACCLLDTIRKENDDKEARGAHTTFGIALEELLEAVTEGNEEKRKQEIVQTIAVLVRELEKSPVTG